MKASEQAVGEREVLRAGRRRRPPVVVAVALALVLASVFPPSASRIARADDGRGESGALSPRNAAQPLGLRAPACELARFEGEQGVARFADATTPWRFEGKITLVDFWASWCPTCEHAFGFLNALARDYRDAGLTVLAVNLDAHARDAVDFLTERPHAFEVARDARGDCPRGFGLVGMPQAFLVDARGRIRAVTRGFRIGEARALRAQIEALLADAPTTLPAVAAGGPIEQPGAPGAIPSAPAAR